MAVRVMEGRFRAAGLLLLLLVLGGATGVAAATLDLGPLFAGYERGCEISGRAAERLIVWASPDEKGRIASTRALPSLWQGHVGASIVADRIDHWLVEVPLRDVRFHGVQVARFERWYGKANGISGWALVLAASPEEVRRRIDERGFRSDADGDFMPELSADQDGQSTRLVCDVSM